MVESRFNVYGFDTLPAGLFSFFLNVKLPTLVTLAVSEITDNSANKGVWDTTQNPIMENNMGHTNIIKVSPL